jgi:hypothetical protein
MTKEMTLLIKLAQVREELDELARNTAALEQSVEQLKLLMCRYKTATTAAEQLAILALIKQNKEIRSRWDFAVIIVQFP